MSLVSEHLVLERGVFRVIKNRVVDEHHLLDDVNAANAISPVKILTSAGSYGVLLHVLWEQFDGSEYTVHYIFYYPVVSMPDRVYQFKAKPAYSLTTYSLKNYYVNEIRRLPAIGLTDDGVKFRIEMKDDVLVETPIERGAEFDDWLAADSGGAIASRAGDIVRISRDNVVIVDIPVDGVGPVVVQFSNPDIVQVAVDSRLCSFFGHQHTVESYDSRIVQMFGDMLLLEDGSIHSTELIDRVAEVEYPQQQRKKAVC